MVLGEVDRQRPQPKDICTGVAHQVERVDRVAEALGHFHALGIHGETVGQNRVVGRPAASAATFEKRRLEPATMLVGAFEVEVGGPALIGPAPAFQDEGVGAAAVEPDVENIGNLFIVVGVAVGAEELRRGAVCGPGVYAALADCSDDPRIDLGINQILAGLAVDEQSDRDPPGTLATEHPVGATFDHRTDAVAALFRDEAGVGDGAQRKLAKRRSLANRTPFIVPALLGDGFTMLGGDGSIHSDEPLRGATVDDPRLRAPAVGVTVAKIACGEERAGLLEVAADRAVGGVELGIDNRALPAEPGPVLAIFAVALDCKDGIDAAGLAQREIVLAVVRGHVDEAGALIGRDEVARKERAGFGEEAAKVVHRVSGDGSD